MEDEWRKIKEKEEEAKENGYGPLVPCKLSVPASAKWLFCCKFDVDPESRRFSL